MIKILTACGQDLLSGCQGTLENRYNAFMKQELYELKKKDIKLIDFLLYQEDDFSSYSVKILNVNEKFRGDLPYGVSDEESLL